MSQAEAAKMLNISVPSIKRAKQVLEYSTPEVIAQIDSGELAVSRVTRDFNRQERIEAIEQGNKPIPNSIGKFNVIYADPPWQYDHPISDSRKIENQYPTMAIDEICVLPIQDISQDDSILFLWASTPMMKKALRVMEAWGFDYRTGMVWVKPSIGPGQWVRQRHELLLIGVKGNIPTPEGGNKPDSVVEADRQEHSKKPEVFYFLIEQMYPTLRKVELFARNKREGWESWGNQA
jgi:N6-adenosine-specific RNA methylase IME4